MSLDFTTFQILRMANRFTWWTRDHHWHCKSPAHNPLQLAICSQQVVSAESQIWLPQKLAWSITTVLDHYKPCNPRQCELSRRSQFTIYHLHSQTHTIPQVKHSVITIKKFIKKINTTHKKVCLQECSSLPEWNGS